MSSSDCEVILVQGQQGGGGPSDSGNKKRKRRSTSRGTVGNGFLGPNPPSSMLMLHPLALAPGQLVSASPSASVPQYPYQPMPLMYRYPHPSGGYYYAPAPPPPFQQYTETLEDSDDEEEFKEEEEEEPSIVWSDPLKPLKHEDGCLFDEQNFQIMIKKVLFTPLTLEARLNAENRTKQIRLHKPAKEIANNRFVVQYLMGQREMLNSGPRYCFCNFKKTRQTQGESLKEKGEGLKDKQEETKMVKDKAVVPTGKDETVLNANADMIQMDMLLKGQLDVFPIIPVPALLPPPTIPPEEKKETETPLIGVESKSEGNPNSEKPEEQVNKVLNDEVKEDAGGVVVPVPFLSVPTLEC